MQFYQWSGITRQGERLKGILQAQDAKAAEIELKNRDIEIINIKEKAPSRFTFQGKIKTKEIVLFTRYLTIMLSAGLPILQALDIIIRDQENEAFKSILISIRSNVAAGSAFSESLNQYPAYFTGLYINLVRAGEKSGSLDKVLKRLGHYLEKIETLKNKIRNALIYPISILIITLLVTTGLLVFVMPQFQTIFQSANVKLPFLTQFMINISSVLRNYWWAVILGLGVVFFGIKNTIKRNEKVSNYLDNLKLKLPIFGNIFKKAIIARYSRTLAITLDSGLPIVESMRSMVHIMGNRKYSAAVLSITDQLVSGNALSSAMESTKVFPNMVIQMVTVGEASGSLAPMLNTIADYYEEEVDSIAENLSTLLEPVIIVVLGVIIGAFVIAMYLPIFRLVSTV